jgi:hypothetical protein
MILFPVLQMATPLPSLGLSRTYSDPVFSSCLLFCFCCRCEKGSEKRRKPPSSTHRYQITVTRKPLLFWIGNWGLEHKRDSLTS